MLAYFDILVQTPKKDKAQEKELIAIKISHAAGVDGDGRAEIPLLVQPYLCQDARRSSRRRPGPTTHDSRAACAHVRHRSEGQGVGRQLVEAAEKRKSTAKGLFRCYCSTLHIPR